MKKEKSMSKQGVIKKLFKADKELVACFSNEEEQWEDPVYFWALVDREVDPKDPHINPVIEGVVFDQEKMGLSLAEDIKEFRRYEEREFWPCQIIQIFDPHTEICAVYEGPDGETQKLPVHKMALVEENGHRYTTGMIWFGKELTYLLVEKMQNLGAKQFQGYETLNSKP